MKIEKAGFIKHASSLDSIIKSIRESDYSRETRGQAYNVLQNLLLAHKHLTLLIMNYKEEENED